MKKLIPSFAEACAVTGDDPNRLPDVSWMPEVRGKALLAEYQMSIITKAQNTLDNFKPDYSNRNQPKWYGWLVWDNSLSAFVFLYTFYTNTFTILGSRFCFIDPNTAKFIYTTHIGLINDIMADLLN